MKLCPSAGPHPVAGVLPSVEAAEADSAGSFAERLPVVGAGFRRPVLLVAEFLSGFSSDAEELIPGDDSSPPSTSATSALISMVGPPWRVIFGTLPSSKALVLPHWGHAEAPTE